MDREIEDVNDVDFCEICGFVVRDGGQHSDEKHGSGRYGIGPYAEKLRQESEAEKAKPVPVIDAGTF